METHAQIIDNAALLAIEIAAIIFSLWILASRS
jgi:hypothetical protein